MDVYLPADFHALHDDVVTDWRDLSSEVRDTSTSSSRTMRNAEQDADPLWLAI
jgi:hypothetical protein